MARYVKLPVVIDAVRWTGENVGEVSDALRMSEAPPNSIVPCSDGSLHIRTLEGTMRAAIGDWIIRGVRGEYYPCKPDIFDATYAPDNGGAAHERCNWPAGVCRAADSD